MRLFSHNDLDGVSPAVLALRAFSKENVHYSCVGIYKIDEVIEEYLEENEDIEEEIYITDISVNEEVAAKLNERVQRGQTILLFDHHSSAKWLDETYEWATVKAVDEKGQKTCGTELFYHHLLKEGKLQETPVMSEYVELVRQFDTWDWYENNNEKAKKLNHLFYLIKREDFIETVLTTLDKEEEFAFTEVHETILALEQEKIDRYIHNKSHQMIKEQLEIGETQYTAGIVFAENYQSELGNALCVEDEELDFVALIDMGKRRIGFRTARDNVNLSEIAARFDGGGHPKAAGCSLGKETFDLFVLHTMFSELEA
jgi:uncharacterized protein